MSRTLRFLALGLVLAASSASAQDEPAPARHHPAWPAAMGWTMVGALGVSAAVVIGTTVRIEGINSDPRWLEARRTTPSEDGDLCTSTLDPWVATRCDEGGRLEGAAAAAMVAGSLALIGAVVFFAIDLSGAADAPVEVALRGAPSGGSLTLSGRFD